MHGVPFDVAEALDDATRLAYVITFGELKGGSWNWDNLEWRTAD